VEERIVRISEAEQMTGRSRSSLLRDVEAGRFPPLRKLGPKAVGWKISEILEWIDQLEVVGHE